MTPLTPRLAAALAGVIGLVIIVAALIIDHGFGYAPCPLCLQQRWPYYIGVPAALLVAALAPRLPRHVTGILLLGLGVLFAWGMGLGVYQAGAEWRFWAGPTDCSAGSTLPSPEEVGNLVTAIQNARIASCTDPALRIFGLSLAGLNAIAMAGLLALVLAGAWRAFRAR